jgi:multidrug transporter EmrE-like cation transporter
MSITGLLLIAIAAAITMAGNVLMRMGIEKAGGFAPDSALAVATGFAKLLLQPLFTAGFFLYFLAGLVWFRVIASEPLSIAYPVLVSVTFLLVSCGAVILFGEPMTARKAAGFFLIISGIVLVTQAQGA